MLLSSSVNGRPFPQFDIVREIPMELLYSLSIILFRMIIDMIILRELVYFYPMAFDIDVDDLTGIAICQLKRSFELLVQWYLVVIRIVVQVTLDTDRWNEPTFLNGWIVYSIFMVFFHGLNAKNRINFVLTIKKFSDQKSLSIRIFYQICRI